MNALPIIVIVVAVVAAGAGGYFVLRPSSTLPPSQNPPQTENQGENNPISSGENVVSENITITLSQSVQIENADIWGGISYDGQYINVTTMMDRNIHLVKFNSSLQQVGSAVQLTTSSDLIDSKAITDHKHIYVNDTLYVAFSLVTDNDLLLFKTDKDGNRIGSIVTVFSAPSAPTNDMILTTDGTYIYVLHFYPNTQHMIHKFDLNLNRVGENTVTSNTLPHNNIGNVLYKDNIFYMFTGNSLSHSSNVILTKWDSNWNPIGSSSQTLIATSDGDGNNFSDGVVYDSTNNVWIIGFHHFSASDTLDNSHLDIATFDTNFNLLDRQHGALGNRPHMLLLDGLLYMVYDNAAVYLNKYSIS